MKKKIWLSAPHMGGDEMGSVKEAFETNWVSPLGPNVDGFERDLEEFTGVRFAAALSSGTAAIHLALVMLGAERDDFVLRVRSWLRTNAGGVPNTCKSYEKVGFGR